MTIWCHMNDQIAYAHINWLVDFPDSSDALTFCIPITHHDCHVGSCPLVNASSLVRQTEGGYSWASKYSGEWPEFNFKMSIIVLSLWEIVPGLANLLSLISLSSPGYLLIVNVQVLVFSSFKIKFIVCNIWKMFQHI